MFYGWVIVGSGFFMSAIAIGARFCYGVFLKPLQAEFGITRAAASSFFSVNMLLSCLVAILGGWAMDRYGPKKVGILMGTFTGLSFLLTSQANAPWQLFITYSLLFSVGTGAIYTVMNATSSKWFVKKRGLVVGVTSSGGGLGTLVIAPFSTYLISSFNWRTAFIVLGVISWIGIVALSLLLRKDPGDFGLLPDGVKSETRQGRVNNKAWDVPRADLSLGQAYRMSQFWLLGFSWLFISLSLHMVFVHIVPHAVDEGISPMDASFILSLLGVANILGRLVLGRLSDTVGRKPLAVIGALTQCAALLWLMWAGRLWMLYAFAIPFGFMFGGASAMITALIGDIFGTRNLGAIMGVLIAGFALGAAIGPAIGGYIFDVSGQYFVAFVAGAFALILAAFTLALVRKVSD